MIVQRVTANSAMVCGMFIPRPPSMSSSDWRDFWSDRAFVPRLKALINFDYARAMVFGAVIPKSSNVTQLEWETFWQLRSDRPPLILSNAKADEAYLRDRNRTARMPKK